MNFNYATVRYYSTIFNKSYNFISKESKFTQRTFSNFEASRFLEMCNQLNGSLYKVGGNSVEEGFDCSGLIVYLYSQLNCYWFKNENNLVNDVSSESMYKFNCLPVSRLDKLIAGDFIFFDADGNNVIEHVSIFNNLDDENNVWVWDASDYPDGEIVNKVSYRKINNFWEKNPKFGKPLKTLEVGSYWDLLIFP